MRLYKKSPLKTDTEGRAHYEALRRLYLDRLLESGLDPDSQRIRALRAAQDPATYLRRLSIVGEADITREIAKLSNQVQ